MRPARTLSLVAPALLVHALLLARPARAEEPPTPTAPEPRSTAIAVTLEVLVPVGGAGCFYRRRYVPGALVTAGSLITSGSFAYAFATQNKDAAIINVVAYGVMRLIGIAAAARPDSSTDSSTAPPPPHDPAPRTSLPAAPARTIGLSHVFSF